MRRAIRRVPAMLIALLMAAPALAQFGHPLKGTWSGDWGPTKENQSHVVLEFHWDGKAVTGTINPGPKAVAMSKASFDAATWGVHAEGAGKDATGKPVTYVIDGTMTNIGSGNRILSGTWTQGGVKGTFKVTRQ